MTFEFKANVSLGVSLFGGGDSDDYGRPSCGGYGHRKPQEKPAVVVLPLKQNPCSRGGAMTSEKKKKKKKKKKEEEEEEKKKEEEKEKRKKQQQQQQEAYYREWEARRRQQVGYVGGGPAQRRGYSNYMQMQLAEKQQCLGANTAYRLRRREVHESKEEEEEVDDDDEDSDSEEESDSDEEESDSEEEKKPIITAVEAGGTICFRRSRTAASATRRTVYVASTYIQSSQRRAPQILPTTTAACSLK